MDAQSYKTQVLEQLRRGYEQRQDWLASLSDAARKEVGVPERWSAKDFVAHIGFWHEYWAGRLSAARRGETLRADEEGPENAAVFEERRHQPWHEVLAGADRAYQQLVTQTEQCSAEDLAGPQYGPAMQASRAGERVAITGYWHIFEHRAQFYAERGDLARATEIHESWVAEYLALTAEPRPRGVALYNLACFYATTGRPQQALARLPEALRLAPDLVEWAPKDSDLDTLRVEPAYRALFEQAPPKPGP